MKYKPQDYALAFAHVVEGRPKKTEKEIITNFLSSIKKNGDEHQLKKIVAETEKVLGRRSGKRRIVLETAREIHPLRTKFKDLFQNTDIILEKINPELIAGIKITIDEESQFDGSFSRKINKILRSE